MRTTILFAAVLTLGAHASAQSELVEANSDPRGPVIGEPTWVDRTALPAGLLYFTAENWGTGARIQWATTAERNLHHFAVEESADLNEWRTVGKLADMCSNDTLRAYSMVVGSTVFDPTLYYRMRQVEQDGTSTLTPVRVVHFAAPGKPAQPGLNGELSSVAAPRKK